MAYTYRRLTPPGDNTREPIRVNGRNYACNVGSTLDVPEFDAKILEANGWINTGGIAATVGNTASRPVNPRIGHVHIDTTLNAAVTYTGGGVWTHHVSGGSV